MNNNDCKRLHQFSTEEIEIDEIDEGQPCTDCECENGYKSHAWRKNCTNCKCTRDSHEILTEHGARSRLGLNSMSDGLEPKALGYSFVPSGLTSPRQVDKYYSTLPSHEVPRLGTKGEALRSQRLVKQLPRQDLAMAACKFIEPAYASGYKDFITARNEIALDIGVAKNAPTNSLCELCAKPLPPQLPCVSAPRLGSSLWHPGCFKCTTCNDLLVDLTYCVYEDKIYCERHYSENLKPRCASCDENFLDSEKKINLLSVSQYDRNGYGCQIY